MLLSCLFVGQQLLELVEALVPERAHLVEPRVDLIESVVTESVDAPLCFGANRHDPGLAQRLEMLRYGGSAHLELIGDLAE